MVIALASVHLGYHDAVDGYVSMALTGAIWWASRRLVGQPHGTQLADLRRWLPARLRGEGATA